ncbi:undecaprenyl-phosphate glucose phosphotransferase [Ramlibacter tataouinensis]|nr:undecaprenyl-phosphate glucose phosphotransferase [Ramlibacter tataouinensis]
MKIYTDTLPPTAEITGRPWGLVRAAIDPLLAVAVYLAALRVFGAPFRQDDLVILTLSFVLTFPGDLPFRRFSAAAAGRLLLQWLKVAAGVSFFWTAKSMLLNSGFQPDGNVVATWLIGAPLAQFLMHWASPRVAPLLFPLYPQAKVVIVGANPVARRVAKLINDGEAEGQRFMGYFDDRSIRRLGHGGVRSVIGRIPEVSDYVKSHGIDTIYIAMPMTTQPRVVSLLESLRDTTASIYFLPDVFIADLIQGRVTTLAGLPVVSVCESPFNSTAGAIKRVIDLTLTILSLPVVLPLMAIIAILVRATSPGPAIFKQRRYGLDGKEIVVWKFRTMTTLEDGDTTYTQVTRGDSRVTPLGRFLRKTSLDELPQLLNVLGGSMSLVGPRPHALAVNEQYRKLIPGYMVRHKVKPGISGWAQVNGCRGGDDLDSMRRRTDYDLAYLRSWSLTLDLLIILKTIKMIVLGDKRAY